MYSSHRRSSCSSSRSIRPVSFFRCRSARVDLAQVRRRCSRLMTVPIRRRFRRWSVRWPHGRQFRRFRRPVLGKEGQQPVGQRILDLVQQSFKRLRAARRLPEMVLLVQQVVRMKTGNNSLSDLPDLLARLPAALDRSSNSERMAERICLATISGFRRLKAGASIAPPRSRRGSSKK